MSCIAVAEIKLKDPDALMEYARQAIPIILENRGELIFHGRKAAVVCGTSDAELVTILRFPDLTSAQAWYYSPDYQALLPTRNRGADEVIVFYEENVLNLQQ